MFGFGSKNTRIRRDERSSKVKVIKELYGISFLFLLAVFCGQMQAIGSVQMASIAPIKKVYAVLSCAIETLTEETRKFEKWSDS